MLWVGLTGGIASGKSTISDILKKSGVPVIDADELAKRAVEPGTDSFEKIKTHFGPGILNTQGAIDRQKLGARVFSNAEELRFLESQIHPFVQKEAKRLRELYAVQGHSFAVYDVPLLFEKNLQSQFDRIVVVGCREDLQIERLRNRNGLSREEALQRLRNQMDLHVKIEGATDVIWNEGSLEELKLQVESLVQKFRNEFSSKA